MQEQRYAEATSSLRSAEILQPSDADILRLLAECYAAQHRFEEELEYLQRLAELSPDEDTYHRLIPATMVKAGKHEEALQLLFKLDYEQSEDDPAIISLIADTALALGKLDIAERYTEKELGIRDEGLGMTQMRMGHIRLLQGDWKGSIAHYEQFVNAYCRETGKDIRAALSVLNSQWQNAQWLNAQWQDGKSPDFLLIHDILLSQAS
jgi:tetratricopeptide (TPR) repeat protein